MKRQAFEMAMLYDFYGDLLTERQREFFDLYHNEDFSLAEIAESAGITRQGVRDVIVRAERTLTEMEEKTGIIQRFLAMRRDVAAIQDAADQLLEYNRRWLEDNRVEELANSIRKAADRLEE